MERKSARKDSRAAYAGACNARLLMKEDEDKTYDCVKTFILGESDKYASKSD